MVTPAEFDTAWTPRLLHLAARIRAGGVTVWPPAETRLRRLAYKLDPLRHIGYYTVR